MWFRNFFLLGHLLVAFRVESHPVQTRDSIVFKSNKLVRINGTDFSELNCTAHDLPSSKLCSNITEITCQSELDQIKSCRVSNEDSIFLDAAIINRRIVCNDSGHIQSNCRLIFQLDQSAGQMQTISKISRLALSPEEEKDLEKRRLWTFICLAIAMVIGLPTLYFILKNLNKKYGYCHSPFVGWKEGIFFDTSLPARSGRSTTAEYNVATAGTTFR